MLSKHSRVSLPDHHIIAVAMLTWLPVIARSALAQEEAEEFSGEFSDPINIHLDNERDGCAC